jgi:tRNA(Ile)-lysidine synthase
MNLFEKRNQLVVADASGRIIWVVGLRTDNRYRISVSTKKTLIIEFR